ncbi:hemerythrin domain-containing protein [Paraburkholderia sediminicola]|uniref:bacteriohemerythrin n=1 Tax=Paraburkholderia sediminicola TaxID=458836 RepID=UPI0038BD3A80
MGGALSPDQNTQRQPGATLSWNDGFLLGFAPMDETHQEFVECVAALQQCDEAAVSETLAAFEEHAVAHFEQEERWMQDTSFPAARCHADEHAAVLRSVREVAQMLRDGAACQVARELAEALASWFPGHADYMDAALSHWMSKRTHGGLPVVLRRAMPGIAAAASDSSLQAGTSR